MKFQRLSQGNSTEDGQQGMGHTRGQETEPQVMEVDQGNGQEHVGTTEKQRIKLQAIEANQHETQVRNVSPFSLVCTRHASEIELCRCMNWGTIRWLKNCRIQRWVSSRVILMIRSLHSSGLHVDVQQISSLDASAQPRA